MLTKVGLDLCRYADATFVTLFSLLLLEGVQADTGNEQFGFRKFEIGSYASRGRRFE